MKKKIFTIISLLVIAQFSFASVVITDLNKTLNVTNSNVQIDVTGDGGFDLTFNFFEANGAMSVTPRIGNGNSFYMATGAISGSNNFPIKLKNNSTFENQTTWKSTGIFIHNSAIGYTDFKGKGKQYIGGKMNFTGTPDTLYYWVLVELNAAGTELNIIKCGFENEANIPLATGNEAKVETTSVSKLISNPSFQVYPNPSKGEIKINGLTNNTQLEIFDLKGALVKNELINENNIIDVSNLRNGIYLIKLITNTDLIFTQKLIIEN
jgi:hypothetical protein